MCESVIICRKTAEKIMSKQIHYFEEKISTSAWKSPHVSKTENEIHSCLPTHQFVKNGNCAISTSTAPLSYKKGLSPCPF